MNRRQSLILLFLISILLAPSVVHAQAWSGIISPSRAIDWTQAGIPGGPPDTNWTQCGSTIAAYSGTSATISNALASCGGQNKYVLLGPGTFTITGQIKFPSTGHVALRGSGPNGTVMVEADSSSACGISSGFICAASSDGSYFNEPPPITYAWTAGYAKGSNQITLSSVAGIDPTKPTILFLEQCDTGYTASSPAAACVGAATDNGQLFVCADAYSAPTGCSSNGPGNANSKRHQLEITVATAVNGNVVTILNPLKYPNWAAGAALGQMPRVWIAQPISLVGVESLSINMGGANVAAAAISFGTAAQYWVSNIKITNFPTWGVESFQTTGGLVKDSYFYHSRGADSYAIRFEGTSNSLVQNNIIHQVFAPVVFDGASSGNVIAYNFVINDNYQSDFMRASFFEHDAQAMDLFEGNVANAQDNDQDHGTANMITRFRNLFLGWDSCANGQCGSSTFKDVGTNSILSRSFGRYGNTIGNLLGTVGYHTTYKGFSATTTVLAQGQGNGAAPNDPLVPATEMLWGNYDTVNAAVRFNTGENGSGAPVYPAIASPSSTLPASFYLTSKPSWFGSIAFPAIGPDITNGNLGVCSGTLNASGHYSGMPATNGSQCTGTSLSTGWGGHANATPAVNCALNILGMPPDGTGGVLNFDANICYGGAQNSQAPNPPTNLEVVVN